MTPCWHRPGSPAPPALPAAAGTAAPGWAVVGPADALVTGLRAAGLDVRHHPDLAALDAAVAAA